MQLIAKLLGLSKPQRAPGQELVPVAKQDVLVLGPEYMVPTVRPRNREPEILPPAKSTPVMRIGICRFCGSPLTDAKSIDRGFGLVCGLRNGMNV